MNTYLAITISPGHLSCQLIAGSSLLSQRDYRYTLLDRKLLAAVNSFLKLSEVGWQDLRAIGIYFDNYRSFSGLRIALSSLNALAWANNIAIVRLTGNQTAEVVARFRRLRKLRFSRQLLPDYCRPADVTDSRRGRRYQVCR